MQDALISIGIPHFLVRTIENSEMLELDPYYFYWVSKQVQECLVGIRLNPPAPMPMLSGKDALEKFIGAGKDEFLLETKNKAKDLIAILDALIQSFQQQGRITITPEEYAAIAVVVDEFESQLEKESKHLYVLCVEDQRLMSAYVLVEQIEKACAPNTWRYMSKLARREIEESGICLAVERYTSSSFHILRCIEAVVKEYLSACGAGLAPSDRNWGRYSELLAKNGAASEVTSILDNLRRDDRNTLMHPEKFLNQDEAIGLFNLSMTALDRLINDMEKRGFAKPFMS